MNIAIIGTTSYKTMMLEHKRKLEAEGHTAFVPVFDDHPDLDELAVCEYNRRSISLSDEVHVFWDQRSMGTIFDFGMVFAMKKPVRIIYMEEKTFKGVMEKYANEVCRQYAEVNAEIERLRYRP